jgi:phage terminase small subunit
MAGKGLHRIGAELLDPFAKHVLVHVQVTGSLCCRYPALLDQLDRVKLEFPTEPSSLHGHLRLHETPKLGVHQTGSSSVSIANRQAEIMMRIASEFGFTPASRSRISVPAHAEPSLFDTRPRDRDEAEIDPLN